MQDAERQERVKGGKEEKDEEQETKWIRPTDTDPCGNDRPVDTGSRNGRIPDAQKQ